MLLVPISALETSGIPFPHGTPEASCRVRTRLGDLTHSLDHVLALERNGGRHGSVRGAVPSGEPSCRG